MRILQQSCTLTSVQLRPSLTGTSVHSLSPESTAGESRTSTPVLLLQVVLEEYASTEQPVRVCSACAMRILCAHCQRVD